MKKILIAGQEIEGNQGSPARNAMVTLHTLGGDTTYFSPAEAREVARALVLAAEFAEGDAHT